MATRRVTGRSTSGHSRMRAKLAAAADAMRGQPAGQVARALGVSERSVHRYWKAMAMVSDNFVPEVRDGAAAELRPRDWEVIAHNIAGWAPDVAAALEVADALGVPRSAFSDALTAIRLGQYAAPATELFTVLHRVVRDSSDAGFRWTACGRVMEPGELWQFLEPADGDPVCPRCLGLPSGSTAVALAACSCDPGPEGQHEWYCSQPN